MADRPPRVEIVVVDNGSTDQSVAIFQRAWGDQVHLIQNNRNLGFAGGVNIGIQHALAAGAQSVLLLNNDTIVDPDMAPRLALAAKELDAGIVGPVIYYHDQPECIWRFADQETRWLPIPVQLTEKALRKASGRPFRVDYVTACGMLIQRRVIESVGLLDARYFMYYEDADYCRRARWAGFDIWCVPQAKMWHKVSVSSNRQKPAMRYAQAWGRAQFYQIHPCRFASWLTLTYLLAKSISMTVQDARLGNWNLVKPLWAGMWDGLRRRPSRCADFSHVL